jgi:hypothetical protein
MALPLRRVLLSQEPPVEVRTGRAAAGPQGRVAQSSFFPFTVREKSAIVVQRKRLVGLINWDGRVRPV